MTEEKMRVVFVLLFFFLIGLIVLGIFYMYKPGINDEAIRAAQGISPTIPQGDTPEPTVSQWRTYTHPVYNVSFTIPDGWNEQDYAALQQQGGALVAFSPSELPCGSCSYIRNGYLALRIFNPTTDPEYYTLFQNRVKALGKNKAYSQVSVGEKPAIRAGNTIAVEHNGWVYEFTLDKNTGTATIDGSSIFKQVINSVKFNENLFNASDEVL